MSLCVDLKSSGWIFPTILLSLYGFLANCRPAEPFLTPYLIGPKNISETLVTNYLFPIWTYSYLAVLPVVFLLTDLLRYKPVIVLHGLFLVSNYVLLCFAPGLTAMTFLQFNYAVVTSTEVAYFSYIYSVIPTEHFQLATGYVRSAVLSGLTFGATLGQLLISLAGVSYFMINAITLGLMASAFIVSLFLPMPKMGMFFSPTVACADPLEERREVPEIGLRAKAKSDRWSKDNLKTAARKMWANLKESYSSRRLVYWSLWWALATANYCQVINYIQLMWDHIEPSSTSSVFNGAVEAVCTLVGFAAVFSVGYMRVRWEIWGELFLGVFSAVGAVSVFFIGLTSNIWISYSCYIIFKATYMLLITITTFQIASNLSMECYALTFGLNTFVAIALQTVLTAAVVDNTGLGLDITFQFIIYGGCYGVISVLFLLRGIYTAFTHHSTHTGGNTHSIHPPHTQINTTTVTNKHTQKLSTKL
ncbi:solute carrier family 19 member 3b [Hoplias malabaricus]|uniref:solute carrier family 19 member 3b n=1 Tax=Hoplias malabaricus TaxID=27720 RepID=UPI0034618374